MTSKREEDRQTYYKKWSEENRNNIRKYGRAKREKNRKEHKFIVCRLCDEKIGAKGIASHLTIHNVSFRDYVKEHLEDFEWSGWQLCDNCKKNLAYKHPTMNKRNASCSRRCAAILRCRKRKEAGLSGPATGYRFSLEQKEKLSHVRKQRVNKSDYINPSTRPEVRKKISKTRIERGVAKGKNNPMYGKTHSPQVVAKIFKTRRINKLEQEVMNYLRNKGVSFLFQAPLKDDTRTYFFDFLLDDWPVFIEVDGDFWHGGPGCTKHYYGAEERRKIDRIKENLANKRGFQVIRIWESEFKKNPDTLWQRIEPTLLS